MKSPTPEQEKKKRRRELYVALVAAILVGLIFFVESEIARSAEEIPFAGHLLAFRPAVCRDPPPYLSDFFPDP